MSSNGFPVELLNAPIRDRIGYFESYTVAHPHLLKAADRLITSLNEPAGSAVIFLYGPTGVGKTTLLRRTIQKLANQFLKDFEEDKGRILFAGFEAPAPDLRNFDWKDFYVRALESLKDPIIDREDHFLARTVGLTRSTKMRLRLLLEKALQYRRPKLFYVDEAQNLSKVATVKHLEDQSDCIKSIANLGTVPILLVGTYDLLYLKRLDQRGGQLCRRSTDVHYSRYRLDCAGDEKAFKNIVRTFQKHLPLEEEPDLVADWDFCYERSLGCIGILKDWLSRTLAGVLVNKGSSVTITASDLEKYAYSLNDCSVILREVLEGEKVLDEIIPRNDYRIKLGLDPATDVELKSSGKPQNSKPSTSKRVGEAKPKRQNIGDAKKI